ncbi:MAG: hypothetical protein HC917_15500 [Richelia sp. SM2_1_7]|nr:hypothetical protein [Richelia sp. SM2_1_7]
MNIKNSLNIHVSETIIQRLRQTKETVFTDDWKQTAIQGSHNAMNTVTDTVQQAKKLFTRKFTTFISTNCCDFFSSRLV